MIGILSFVNKDQLLHNKYLICRNSAVDHRCCMPVDHRWPLLMAAIWLWPAFSGHFGHQIFTMHSTFPFRFRVDSDFEVHLLIWSSQVTHIGPFFILYGYKLCKIHQLAHVPLHNAFQCFFGHLCSHHWPS